jgi:alpha/beta superfamily hydrolase
VREEPQNFGASGELFGILTEPSEELVSRRRPAVLFLNVGANHHVGPNRLYVSLCRDLAALGYLTFRFDTAGLGDSRGSGGASAEGAHRGGAVDDVQAAMSLLGGLRRVERVVLVGICSGARLAFHTTMVDPRVAGQILINPQTFSWKTGDPLDPAPGKSYKSTRYYLEALSDRAVWAQALRGALDVRGVAGALGGRFVERLLAERHALLARLNGRPEQRSEIERAFCAASDRGVASLLVFSSNDSGLDMIEEHLGRDGQKVRARRNIHMSIIEGADHTFTPIASQRDLRALIAGFVTDAFP